MEGVEFSCITEEKAAWLVYPFSEEEVLSTIKSLPEDKALGPYRFPIKFFKDFWLVVGPDVMRAMVEFHNKASLCRSLNSTFITLVPRRPVAVDMKDFIPISLLGSFYKILLKTLARRMEEVMGLVISANQNAFVRGRQILDCSFIANECIDAWIKDKHQGVVVQVDM